MPITKATASSVAPAAKGELVAGSATNDAAVLTVGANDTILTADSTAATGMKWAASQAVQPLLIPITSGVYVKSQMLASASAQAGVPQDTTHYIPIFLTGATYDRIAFRTGASQSGSSTVRLGLYNVGANNRPTTVVFDAGTVAANAASTVFEITINETITAGNYYLAICRQNATNLFAIFGDGILPYGGLGSTFSVGSTNSNIFTQSGVSGAFATAGTLVADNLQVFMGMRFA